MMGIRKKSVLAAAVSLAIGTVVVLAMEARHSQATKGREETSLLAPRADTEVAALGDREGDRQDTLAPVDPPSASGSAVDAPKDAAETPIVEADSPDQDEDLDYRAWAPGFTEFGAQQPSAEELAALRENRRQRIRAHFDSRLEQEPVDAKWQLDVSQRATSAIEMLPQLERSSIEGAQCGATLCRLSILASDENALRELRQLYAGVGLVLGSDAWAFTDETQFKTHIYVSRPGGKLPPMQAMPATPANSP